MSVHARMGAWLDSQEFYDLMQRYRHTPIAAQHETGRNYQAVIEAVLLQLGAALEAEAGAGPSELADEEGR